MHTLRARPWRAAAAIASAALLALTGLATGAQAHGSLESPVSRVYGCYVEGPERPATLACQAAVAAGGSQPLYDWNEVNLANANGQHREVIPDGQLCSAGRAKYAAFDAPRLDWPTTSLIAGADVTFAFGGTAPHRGGFAFYITRDGYDATQPLRWSDLEAEPFLQADNPPLVNGSYIMQAHLPAGKQGRHLIYGIWQRSDSPEAFYSCSDVLFGGGSAVASAPLPPTLPPVTETEPVNPPSVPVAMPEPVEPAASGDVAPWSTATPYAVGALVTYDGVTYACRQAHTAQVDWTPPETLALRLPLAPPHPDHE